MGSDTFYLALRPLLAQNPSRHEYQQACRQPYRFARHEGQDQRTASAAPRARPQLAAARHPQPHHCHAGRVHWHLSLPVFRLRCDAGRQHCSWQPEPECGCPPLHQPGLWLFSSRKRLGFLPYIGRSVQSCSECSLPLRRILLIPPQGHPRTLPDRSRWMDQGLLDYSHTDDWRHCCCWHRLVSLPRASQRPHHPWP